MAERKGVFSFGSIMRFHAEKFVALTQLLSSMTILLLSSDAKISTPETAEHLRSKVLRAIEICGGMGLTLTAKKLRTLRDALAPEANPQGWITELQQLFAECNSRLHDELEERIFIAADPIAAEYLDPLFPPFGDDVFSGFPSAIIDVEEAGACLAVHRHTASVFHSMRVMESGLKSLASELGIPYAPSWESYIRQLKTILGSDWKSKPVDLQAKQSLYTELLGDMEAVKIAWRNPTMHIVNNYDFEAAHAVYLSVKQFMARMALAGFKE